jgi:hypothetical protein
VAGALAVLKLLVVFLRGKIRGVTGTLAILTLLVVFLREKTPLPFTPFTGDYSLMSSGMARLTAPLNKLQTQ